MSWSFEAARYEQTLRCVVRTFIGVVKAWISSFPRGIGLWGMEKSDFLANEGFIFERRLSLVQDMRGSPEFQVLTLSMQVRGVVIGPCPIGGVVNPPPSSFLLPLQKF